MIFENVEFQGFTEVIADKKFKSAVNLQRVPESVRKYLNPSAKERVLAGASSEIRFFAEGKKVYITLSCVKGTINVRPFFGPFQYNDSFTINEEPRTIEIIIPETLKNLDEKYSKKLSFSPKICRLLFTGQQVRFHKIEGDGIRPPKMSEKPKLRYLSYGTSITHGAAATGPHLCYVAQIARRLNADLINLGVGGACHCENELADYIAERTDWDIATLSLSVNMMGAGFTLDEFYDRVSYMVNKVGLSNTARQIFCITIFPHGRDFNDKSDEFRQKLRDAVKNYPNSNVHILEGPDMLSDFGGLSTDLLHPGDNGMIEMGENIAKFIKKRI